MNSKRFALTGYPLGHTKSPEIHSALMKCAGIDGTYSCFELPPDKLSRKAEIFSLDGFNVTIPHKTNIIPLLDRVDGRAELYGAVNTVKCENGVCTGYNTDCEGFLHALEGADMSLEGDVLILGSGGVSRMFAFESALAGARLTIASRNTETAEKIKAEIKQKLGKGCEVMPLSAVGGGYDLIINGTPVGMSPNTNASPLLQEAVSKCGAVFDAIYNPPETLLLRFAKEAGIKYSNGLSMLVWQAAVAEEIWNGIKFKKEDIEGIIRQLEG